MALEINKVYIVQVNRRGKQNIVLKFPLITPNGKSKCFEHSGDLNKIQNKREKKLAAELLRQAFQNKIDNGWRPWNKIETFKPAKLLLDDPDFYTLKYCIDVYAAHILERLKKTSYQSTLPRLKKLLNWAKTNDLHGLALHNISSLQLQQFFKSLNVSNTTINNYRIDINTFFAFWQRQGIIGANPVSNISKLPENRMKHKIFSEAEMKLLNNELAKQADLHRFIRIFAFLAIRPGNMMNLKVENFDLNQWQLITQSDQMKTKGRAQPLISIIQKDLLSLNLHLYPKHYYVFTANGVNEKPSYRDYFSKKFAKIKSKLGFGREHSLYSYRHTVAVNIYHNMIKKGVRHNQAEAFISDIYGHKSLKSTKAYLAEIGATTVADYSEFISLDI